MASGTYGSRDPAEEKKGFWQIIVENPVSALFTFAMLIVIAIIAAGMTIAIVPTGHRGIYTQFGSAVGETSEGLVFKIPFVDDVKVMNVQVAKYETNATAASNDLQDVFTGVAVNYHVQADKVMELYRAVGVD